MKDLIISGSGGLAKEVYGLVKTINSIKPTWNILGFTSNDKLHQKVIDGYSILGDNSYLEKYEKRVNVVIAVGDSNIRQYLHEKFSSRGIFDFPNIIHPNISYDKENIDLGVGNIIANNVIISPHVKIGHFNIINMGSIIAHDCIISSYCNLNPGCNISGNVIINNKTLIGSNAVVLQGVKIANNTILGIGGVLTRDSSDNCTYLGNPAKKIG